MRDDARLFSIIITTRRDLQWTKVRLLAFTLYGSFVMKTVRFADFIRSSAELDAIRLAGVIIYNEHFSLNISSVCSILLLLIEVPHEK